MRIDAIAIGKNPPKEINVIVEVSASGVVGAGRRAVQSRGTHRCGPVAAQPVAGA